MTHVQVDLLGPLRVRADDREIDVGGPRNRALVVRLALDAGRRVPAATLVADLWVADVPVDASNALQSIVSRTRRRLPAGSLDSAAGGYVLRCDVDASEFEQLAAAGRAEEALALWRGDALCDVSGLPFASAAASRLEELRLSAVESSLAARARRGDDPGLVAELAELTAAHPYRDGFWRLRLTALADGGRSSEALTVYEELRSMLADELGADPAPDLQELHLAILRGKSGSRHSHRTLPSALTSFVGREGAIDELEAALADHRLVTILGPGGAGKTRLAVETARATLDRFEDVWLAELAPVTGGEDVVHTILAGIGQLEVAVLDRGTAGARPDDRARLLEAVRGVEGLLLDNCEHLVDEVARIAEDVLAHAPRVRILATSREPLRIIGEFEYQLGPLAMPADHSSVEEAMQHSAVQLFVARAQTVDQSFVLSAATLPAVREICIRLDGQPLAIELAAARLRTLTAGQVAARLSDRFRLLTGGSRTALPRHRTLRAVVEWSWDLLEKAERDLAERLAVFPGGVTVESARAIGGGPDTDELLESLADKSLLVPIRGSTTRFRMLETLREYGVERLVERAEARSVREAHLSYFRSYVERYAPQLRDSRQLAAIAALDAERGNLTAAIRYAVDSQDRASAARLVALLGWYLSIRNQHVEASTWAEAVLGLAGEADAVSEFYLQALSLIRVAAVPGAEAPGEPAPWQGPVDRMLEIWDEHHPHDCVVDVVFAAMRFFGVVGDREPPEVTDPWTRAMTNLVSLVLLENAGRVDESVSLVDETIEGFREIGDRWGLATSLAQRGLIEAYDGEAEAAIATWQEAIPLLEELGAHEDAEFSAMKVMSMRLATVEPSEVRAFGRELRDDIDRARQQGSRRKELMSLMTLALLEHRCGDDARGVEHLEYVLAHRDGEQMFAGGQMEASVPGSLAVLRASGGDLLAARVELVTAGRIGVATRDMPIIAQLAAASAFVDGAAGDNERAARVLGAADAIRGRADLMDRDAQELAASLRERLGSDLFEALHAEGLALDRDAAIELALPSEPA